MSQQQEILEYIKRYGSITPMQAYELGITKLATRVSEMRKKGIEFHIEIVRSINKRGKTCRYARYSFPIEEEVINV